MTARWEHLVLLNYVRPPDLLAPLVPAGTRLDLWNGEALISLVGFMFRDTRVLGLPIPGHRTFEEVNLRFYVRRDVDGQPPKRAVVFIRELVPRRAISWAARTLYNEPYLSVPMAHQVDLSTDLGGRVEYSWRHGADPFRLWATASGPAAPFAAASEAAFITEHYWGYTRQRDGGTLEYEVAHPPWRVWTAGDAGFEGRAEGLYGPEFGAVLAAPPRSGFVAVGSPVAVYRGRRID